MARVVVEMDFDFEGFDSLTEEEQLHDIESVLKSGAESTCSEIKVSSVRIKDN